MSSQAQELMIIAGKDVVSSSRAEDHCRQGCRLKSWHSLPICMQTEEEEHAASTHCRPLHESLVPSCFLDQLCIAVYPHHGLASELVCHAHRENSCIATYVQASLPCNRKMSTKVVSRTCRDDSCIAIRFRNPLPECRWHWQSRSLFA